MAIGANWAEIWAPVWKAVWTQVPPIPPTPDPEPEQQPGGKSKRKQRFYVEVDGQQFFVNSASEAIQLLDRAKALAERLAETQAQELEQKAKRSPKKKQIKLQTPRIAASPELQLDLAPIRQDLTRIYDNAAAVAELRLLLQRAIEEEEEEALLLLM